MKVITAPNEIVTDLPTIFLAGGITDCDPWQTVVIEGFRYGNDAVLLNPRRKTFSIYDPEESRKQIEWEFNALTNCDIFAMQFAGGDSVQPICMYELGRYVTLKNRKLDRIVIGVDRNYLRRNDVFTQMKLIDPKLADKISGNIEDHVSNIKMALKQLQKDRSTFWGKIVERMR